MLAFDELNDDDDGTARRGLGLVGTDIKAEASGDDKERRRNRRERNAACACTCRRCDRAGGGSAGREEPPFARGDDEEDTSVGVGGIGFPRRRPSESISANGK